MIQIDFFLFSFYFFKNTEKTNRFASSIPTEKDMAECSGNLSGTLKPEKCSNRLVHAVTEYVDITFQYNIGFGYTRMFSRQLFKPAVAFKVGKVGCFYFFFTGFHV